MSTFEQPMTETELHEVAAGTWGPLVGGVVKTALHHLARAKALEAEIGTVRAQLDAEIADAAGIRRASGAKSGEPTIAAVDRTERWAKSLEDQLSKALARAKAAEEARDLAIAERDEAYKQRDALQAQINADKSPIADDGDLLCRAEMVDWARSTMDGHLTDSLGYARGATLLAMLAPGRDELAEARRERDEAREISRLLRAQEARDFNTIAQLRADDADVRGVVFAKAAQTTAAAVLDIIDASRKGQPSAPESMRAVVLDFVKGLQSQINDARAILGAAPDELLSDAAKRTVRAAESVYPGPQVLREILGAAEGQGVIPAARAVVAEVDRLCKQVGEVQRLAGVCETMGAKAIGDARRSERVAVTVEHVRDASIAMDRRKTWNAADPAASWAELLADLRVALAGCGADELAQIRHALNVPLDETALQSVVWLKNTLAEVRGDLAHHNSMRYEVARAAGLPDATAATWVDVVAKVTALSAEAEPPQADLREILRARDGEPLGDAARRLAASRDEMMEEASRARTELGARTNESAEDAALRVMRSLLKAQSALGEVFEIQHEITIAGDLVMIRVAPLRDPAIRALPLGVRLGLVVCDD